jgi:sigma-E factor negative regulatory protein RseB
VNPKSVINEAIKTLRKLLYILRLLSIFVFFCCLSGVNYAQNALIVFPAENKNEKTSELDTRKWLMRTHQASRYRAYAGTFVVTADDQISTARIWHVCDGEQQVERVESLTGAPRSTFRRNDQVMTFFPENRVVVAEKRESLGVFPGFLQSADFSIAQFYAASAAGRERIAGFEADIVQLKPADTFRFGYKIWTETKTGLVIKLQTIDMSGRVLEQAAFSELNLDAPVSISKLTQMMGNTEGYQVEKVELSKTTALAEGWTLKSAVPGFNSVSCYKRSVGVVSDMRQEKTIQWVFSDGLASVSLFVEPFDVRRHTKVAETAMGATHVLSRRAGHYWVTAVGEVPTQTLAIFSQGLERKK